MLQILFMEKLPDTKCYKYCSWRKRPIQYLTNTLMKKYLHNINIFYSNISIVLHKTIHTLFMYKLSYTKSYTHYSLCTNHFTQNHTHIVHVQIILHKIIHTLFMYKSSLTKSYTHCSCTNRLTQIIHTLFMYKSSYTKSYTHCSCTNRLTQNHTHIIHVQIVLHKIIHTLVM